MLRYKLKRAADTTERQSKTKLKDEYLVTLTVFHSLDTVFRLGALCASSIMM